MDCSTPPENTPPPYVSIEERRYRSPHIVGFLPIPIIEEIVDFIFPDDDESDE